MQAVAGPPEQRILLRNVAWETYERLLADHLDSSAPRFAYDRGLLEIVRPSTEHETVNRTLALLVEVVAEELGIDVLNVGSMTFRRQDLQRGFEPGSSFYIQHESSVRGRTQIDPLVDPPPDLVIEIDVTHPSLNKLPIYAHLGVPEVWRYHDRRVTVLRSDGEEYRESAASVVLPPLTGDALTGLLSESRTLTRTAWLRALRAWARNQVRAVESTS
ncbi:MAG: Uma2 family endonuclease [Chloroflexota bacterium]|nr:Uma2 family endonuclease [Chloroflexota bacterium]